MLPLACGSHVSTNQQSISVAFESRREEMKACRFLIPMGSSQSPMPSAPSSQITPTSLLPLLPPQWATLCWDKAWFDTSVGHLHISSSPFVRAPATVLPHQGALLLVTSNTTASNCQERADVLAGLGAATSGKPLLINWIHHVIALITVKILDRDDDDAVQSLADNKYTHISQRSHTQFSGPPYSMSDPSWLHAGFDKQYLGFSPGILLISSPLPAPGFILICLPPPPLYSLFCSNDVIWRAALRGTISSTHASISTAGEDFRRGWE